MNPNKRFPLCLVAVVACSIAPAYSAADTSWEKLSEQAGNARENKQYAESEKLYTEALRKCEESCGKTSLSYAEVLEDMAILYRWKRNYPLAEKLAKQSL